LNIFAHRNADIDVCFMAKVAEITAGAVCAPNSLFKDEGEREQFAVTQQKQQHFVCSDYFIEFSSPWTQINASMQRKPANKTAFYQKLLETSKL
jgi:hypothetical protein